MTLQTSNIIKDIVGSSDYQQKTNHLDLHCRVTLGPNDTAVGMASVLKDVQEPQRAQAIDHEDDISPSWLLQTIRRGAWEECADRFKVLPTLQTLILNPHQINSKSYQGRRSWPQDGLSVMLRVGKSDEFQNDNLVEAWVFVHGERQNQVGYFFTKEKSVVRLEIETGLNQIRFEEPFCDLGGGTSSVRSVHSIIRTLVLYHYLNAGHIEEMGDYSTFWVTSSASVGGSPMLKSVRHCIHNFRVMERRRSVPDPRVL